MPQPYSRARSRGALNIGAKAAEARPTLAIAAADVIASYSILETYLVRLFVAMSGSNARAASAVFAEVRAQAFQRSALQAVADNVFQADLEFRELVAVALELAEKAAKPRNRIAHWAWAYDDALPDVLLFVDPRALTNLHVDTSEWGSAIREAAKIRAKTEDVSLPGLPSIDHDRVLMYTAEDFRTAQASIGEVIEVAGLLGMIADINHPVVNARVRPQLLAQPAVARELARLRKDRQSDP